MFNILCFGDSIAYGEFDVEGGGWVDRLKRFGFSEFMSKGRKGELKVTNLGISGEYSHEAVKRLEGEIEPRLDDDLKTITLFAYGANDDSFFPAKDEYATSPEDFKKNLEKMNEIAKKYNAQAFFLTITPVIESKNATLNHRGKTRNNDAVRKYSEIIKEVVREQGAHLIDIFENYPADDSLFCEDGLHPNDKGHQLIAQVVKESLLISI